MSDVPRETSARPPYITKRKLQILDLLYRAETPVRRAYIAHALGADTHTVYKSLRIMTSHGWVRFEMEHVSGGPYVYSLTDTGRELTAFLLQR